MGRYRDRRPTMNGKKHEYDVLNMGFGTYLLIGGICACVVFAAYFTFYTPTVHHVDVSDSDQVLGWYEEKHAWKLQPTSDAGFKKVTESVSFKRFKNDFLPRFLVVRPPGSEGIIDVKRFITDTMENLGWAVEEDTFTEKPPDPYPETEFTNVIATLNPNAKRRLVLACHYDSKITPDGFIGATDSSVPCAMMLEIATALQKFLTKMPKSSDLTLQLLFFDGEEAFVHWSKTDSIYGARHLAETWSRQRWPAGSKSDRTMLDSIDVLVLLDLLGEANPKFYDYHRAHSTSKNNHFKQLAKIDARLKDKKTYFIQRTSYAAIEDDHIPFLRKNVPILHIIPSPFPHQWHKLGDDGKNLDDVTMLRLIKIFAVFVTEYLHLQVS